jgi:hypothetical protein
MNADADEPYHLRQRRREALLEGIGAEQALLARLDREQADARARLASLHAQLGSLGSEPQIRVRPRRRVEAVVPL